MIGIYLYQNSFATICYCISPMKLFIMYKHSNLRSMCNHAYRRWLILHIQYCVRNKKSYSEKLNANLFPAEFQEQRTISSIQFTYSSMQFDKRYSNYFWRWIKIQAKKLIFSNRCLYRLLNLKIVMQSNKNITTFSLLYYSSFNYVSANLSFTYITLCTRS